MRMLITLLIGSFLGGMIVIILLNRWLASVAYRPFRQAIREVNDLSTQNLDVQIELPTEKDELYDLIATFNTQLARIAEMVAIQKNFARYVSHEFKTPLAAMLGNLEVLTIKQRSPEEYERMAHKLIDEIYQLENILNTLSIISDLKKDNDVAARIRIDELLWEIIARVGRKYPSVPVDMNLEIDSNDEEKLWISLNRTQLAMALTNIIENAAKYSAGKPVLLRLDLIDDQLSLEIRDHGIGIPQDQLKSVCKPLYRAGNTGSIQGSGIGLSIALHILERPNLRFEIESREGTGPRVTILFRSFDHFSSQHTPLFYNFGQAASATAWPFCFYSLFFSIMCLKLSRLKALK